MGGGHHHEPFKVPHWKQYNNWQRCPELVEHAKRLERIGLKDPFIRNYVTLYDPELGTPAKKNLWTEVKRTLKPGWKLGIFIAATWIGVEEGYTYFKYGYTSWNKPHH